MQEFHIGPWLIQPNESVIRRDGRVRHVEPKAMSVLLVLVAGGGATVSRNELLESVWPNQDVSDDVLTGCISTLRRALGDDPRKSQFIETVPKKGYRLVEPVRSMAEQTKTTGFPSGTVQAQRPYWALVFLVAILVIGGWWVWHSEPDTDLQVVREHSIAVLPFDVFSDRIELAYFASGLEEELIHQLASNPDLHVIARTSSARFADTTQSIREISDQLGVRHVIEGSVRDSEEGMRITVQLIDAETDAHLWSKVFDANQENLVGVQEQVSEAVSRLVASSDVQSQGLGDARDVHATPTRHPVPEAAYRLYLLGEAHMRVGTADSYIKAGDYFSDATRIAPDYALAWSRLAAAYLLRYQYAGLPLEEASAQAKRALDHALEHDPSQPEALATLGLMNTYLKDYTKAEAYFEHALELQPNLRFALHNLGFALWNQAKFEAALRPLQQALTIDPLSGVTHFLFADSLAGMEDFESSLAQYQRCMDVLPDYHSCALGFSTLQRLTGNYQDAWNSLEHAASLTDDDNFWQLLSSGLLTLQLSQYELSSDFFNRAAKIFPRNYALARGQLYLSLATGTLDEFLESLEKMLEVGQEDRELGLIAGLGYFHAGDCTRALESYPTNTEQVQTSLVNIWDAEFGFSHAIALAWCHGQLGNPEQGEAALARLRDYGERLPDNPIFAQRFLYAAYFQLAGQHEQAQRQLNRLRDEAWPAVEIIEMSPAFQ